MGSASSARILICGESQATSEDVRQLLESAGNSLEWQPIVERKLSNLSNYDLIVLESTPLDRAARHFCRGLRSSLADHFVPILFLTSDQNLATRLEGLECGADTYLVRPFSPGELLAQAQAFLRMERLHDGLIEKTADFHRVNKRLHQAYQQIDQELELSRRIQQSLLPQSFPDMPPARFAVDYRPCGRVGGDFYDVLRLDEDHVGFYVADVMGHGLPASLLTIFLKKAIRTKEISGQEYRLIPPNEVLQHLNREMIDQAVAENPFITMVYALFNRRDCTLSFARAGHPHPLYVPRSGKPELWQVHGTLLGVFDTQFTLQTHHLQPGDKLLLHTDGLETSGPGGNPPTTNRLLESALRYQQLPIQAFVEQLSRDLFEQTGQPDDFTLLGLELGET